MQRKARFTMNKKDIKKFNKIISKQKPVITLVLGIIVATIAVCVILNKYITNKIYEAKWHDYKDCGVDNL